MTDSKETQIEGQPTIIRKCSKCNKQYNNEAKFCMDCGSPIIVTKQKMIPKDEFKQMLETLQVNEFGIPMHTIFQRQPENFVHVTTVGELKKMAVRTANTRNSDGSIDFRYLLPYNNNHHAQYITYDSLPVPGSSSCHQVNNREIFGIKYSTGCDLANLGYYLLQLIDHEITNPVIRNYVCFQADKDISDSKIHEDEIVTIRLIYDQIDEFPEGHGTLDADGKERFQKLNKELRDHWYWRKVKDSKQEVLRQSARQRCNNWDSIPAIWFDNKLQQIKDQIDALVMECGASHLYDPTMYTNAFGQWKRPAYNPKLLPKRSQIPTKEDIALKEVLSKIQQDVFYSRKMRQIYTHDELIELFKLEGTLFKNLNFREQSKNIKIHNVNAYILNENIDGLFFFIEARKHTSKIKELELNESFNGNLIAKLFGF